MAIASIDELIYVRTPVGQHKIHDRLFKSVYKHVDAAAAELRSVLPRALADAVDWSSLTLIPGSFGDLRSPERTSDLLFSANVAGQSALLHFLFEHQSTAPRHMTLRVLGYAVRIWEDFVELDRNAPLPPIIPVIFHHGDSGWSAPTAFEDLFDPAVLNLPHLARFVPSFQILIDDLSSQTDEQIAAIDLPAVPHFAKWVMRHARQKHGLREAFESVRPVLVRALSGKEIPEAIRFILEYTARACADEAGANAIIDTVVELAPSTRTIAMTIAERIAQEASVKARQEGFAEARTGTLRKQLTLKFGELSDADNARIDSASAEDLERYLERILYVDSIAAVFGE